MTSTATLHAVEDDPVDRARAMSAVADLLIALGYDVADEHLADTPRRVVDALIDMTTSHPFVMTTFPNDERYDQPVVVRGIRFTSLCEHHLLPFRGEVDVAYLPGTRLVGLSKLARVVERHARRLQVQERMTVQIADDLEEALDPRGVAVVVRAEHLCMSIRGVRTPGAETRTAAVRGAFQNDPELRFALRTETSGRMP
ncbi:GTP cyclohydrolase [Microbacterium mangrovi]|uniref:GTP cyclohydrolase 1 n=1 Tax=Microbacterium mangrovi TaxID=1348253 RepID=A0A0B2AAK9_9MICO|nr:GTP cyclohydrolase I FolE [Microbacterium mangrovi]KHK98622.1 GTP cyclohydrolase [Microbacterium mangrovi]